MGRENQMYGERGAAAMVTSGTAAATIAVMPAGSVVMIASMFDSMSERV
jgi:hypothetical protein